MAISSVLPVPYEVDHESDQNSGKISIRWNNYYRSLNQNISNLYSIIDLLGQSLIPVWVAGSYLAGYMVYEGASPQYFYVANKNGSTEPATDFYIYDPAVTYDPGTKGWTRYDKFSNWVQFVNMNKYGP